jgi:hypothetical protein
MTRFRFTCQVEMFVICAPEDSEAEMQVFACVSLICLPATVLWGARCVGPRSKSTAFGASQNLVKLQQEFVAALKLHARVLLMPSEELGASAYQKVSQLPCHVSDSMLFPVLSHSTQPHDYDSFAPPV